MQVTCRVTARGRVRRRLPVRLTPGALTPARDPGILSIGLLVDEGDGRDGRNGTGVLRLGRWPRSRLTRLGAHRPPLATLESLAMASEAVVGKLTPLQRAIYDVDQLGLNLRDSMRLVTQRVGFFVGQERYLRERQSIAAVLDKYGASALEGTDPSTDPREATHQIGSAS